MATDTTVAIGCAHCGDACDTQTPHRLDDKVFCCQGCQSVYEILHTHDLCQFYQLDDRAGRKTDVATGNRFAFLDHAEVRDELVQPVPGGLGRVTFFIPIIHCTSCIWLLENLHRLHPAVRRATVHFTRKEVTVQFDESSLSLRGLAELLVQVGYAPDVRLGAEARTRPSRQLWYKIGITGFCFGNIMLLSFPEYLGAEVTDASYLRFFAGLNVLLSLPVFFYGAADYFLSAYRSLRRGYVNLDVPIALGVLALFGRSLYEIISQTGAGYLDSLGGLIFFLLIGKWYQGKTYRALAFDRDYRSYFPMAVTRQGEAGQEESVLLKDLAVGDRIVVRHQELIPADAVLSRGEGKIDYSFVTGEAAPERRRVGDTIYAGGRQTGGPLELVVTRPVSSSYLTELWNQDAFKKDKRTGFEQMADQIGKRFTVVVVLIAVLTGLYWYTHDESVMMNAVTSVLIVACPCALALSLPFTFGHAMRILGQRGLFVKNTEAVEKLASLTDVVFDKTGTITQAHQHALTWVGPPLSDEERGLLRTLTRNSVHPLSQTISREVGGQLCPVTSYRETAGQGLEGAVGEDIVRIGAAGFVGIAEAPLTDQTRVYVAINGTQRGHFRFENQYRPQFETVLRDLAADYQLHLLSGDHDRERARLAPHFGTLHFRQQPLDKLRYVEARQRAGGRVLMVGDGLNDAGALQQSDLGIALADDVHHFSPACDAILRADSFGDLSRFVRFGRDTRRVVLASLFLSFAYNIIGLSFAVTGILTPLIAAILMPISSVTVVSFVTMAVEAAARKQWGSQEAPLAPGE